MIKRAEDSVETWVGEYAKKGKVDWKSDIKCLGCCGSKRLKVLLLNSFDEADCLITSMQLDAMIASQERQLKYGWNVLGALTTEKPDQ